MGRKLKRKKSVKSLVLVRLKIEEGKPRTIQQKAHWNTQSSVQSTNQKHQKQNNKKQNNNNVENNAHVQMLIW